MEKRKNDNTVIVITITIVIIVRQNKKEERYIYAKQERADYDLLLCEGSLDICSH